MSDITPSPGRRVSRKTREQRAFGLVMGGGVAGVVGVVGALLAIVGVVPWSLPFLAVIIATVCFVLFRRTTG